MQNDSTEPAVSSPKRKRILLVEDEPMARLQLLQKLRESGFDVDVASNGQVALDRIRAVTPDAIFMDLLLPAVKGVDVIKGARQDPKFRDRPIYVCTSAALIETWTRRATKAGATKVFNRAVTPMDAIAAEVAADLGGASPSASGAKAPPRPAVTDKAPGSKRETKSQAATASDRPAPSAEAASRPAPLLSRVFNSFRFVKTPAPARGDVPPAPPAPPPASLAQAAGAPTPA